MRNIRRFHFSNLKKVQVGQLTVDLDYLSKNQIYERGRKLECQTVFKSNFSKILTNIYILKLTAHDREENEVFLNLRGKV